MICSWEGITTGPAESNDSLPPDSGVAKILSQEVHGVRVHDMAEIT